MWQKTGINDTAYPLDLLEDWIFYVRCLIQALAVVWHKALHHICQSIEHHFKPSVVNIPALRGGGGRQSRSVCRTLLPAPSTGLPLSAAETQSGIVTIDESTIRLSYYLKWRLVVTKGGKFSNVIMHNDIWTNQKTESSMYHWQCAHALFKVTCFPIFGASDYF